jgi:hypothetical protein
MKKMTKQATKKVVGGAGMSGALFSGIAAIINSISNGISTIIGSVVNAVHSFTDGAHYKAEFKYGSASMTYDDTKRADLEKESLKHQIDHHNDEDQNHLLKVKPMLDETFHEEINFHHEELSQIVLDEPLFTDPF